MQHLTLQVEIEGYKLLSRFVYLRMIGDLTGESLKVRNHGSMESQFTICSLAFLRKGGAGNNYIHLASSQTTYYIRLSLDFFHQDVIGQC